MRPRGDPPAGEGVSPLHHPFKTTFNPRGETGSQRISRRVEQNLPPCCIRSKFGNLSRLGESTYLRGHAVVPRSLTKGDVSQHSVLGAYHPGQLSNASSNMSLSSFSRRGGLFRQFQALTDRHARSRFSYARSLSWAMKSAARFRPVYQGSMEVPQSSPCATPPARRFKGRERALSVASSSP